MRKIKTIAACVMLATFMLFNYGCALLGAAVSAGISYAIYKATKK